MKQLLAKRRFEGAFLASSLVLLVTFLSFHVSMAQGDLVNKVTSISLAGQPGSPIVQINTESPVGYRYTVYDSYDPVRVVIDLPDIDVSLVKESIKVGNGPLQEIRIESFDLASGKLGRVELILKSEAKYTVNSEENIFSVSFNESGSTSSANVEAQKIENKSGDISSVEKTIQTGPPNESVSAKSIKAVRIDSDKTSIDLDGDFDKFQYFHLGSPLRLVVDVYGVKPLFTERVYDLSGGFRQLRVGESDGKTRFVLDAIGKDFPTHHVGKEGNSLIIVWNGDDSARKKTESELKLETPPPVAAVSVSDLNTKSIPSSLPNKNISPSGNAGLPVAVEGIDFKIENGKSILTVSLSGQAEVTPPVSEKDLVRFGIKNVTISRALRRSIDASSFPSAIKRIIPYIVEGGKEVRFISELKGIAPFSLKQENGKVFFIVENNGFAEPAPPVERMIVAVPTTTLLADDVVAPSAPLAVPAETSPAENKQVSVQSAKVVTEDTSAIVRNNEFTGEKISLVFDDANIRNILQLIGEVSDLNIIAGEDVKGTITLRLIDVPWDQALSLILDSKNLGMLREGNVVRIMPKDQIRSMRQAEMTAVKEERQLEQVVTEIIPVNYTALGNITTPAKELLTDRGKITEDTRNKQIIVTDIPSTISSIKRLAAILDTPERQVMIEARIVEASSSFGRDLGVKWGISYDNNPEGPGDIDNASLGLGGSFLIAPPAAGSVMGNAGLGGGISFGRLGIDSTVLDLRISALESGGYGKVISTPRVSTLNGGTATISQGTKIPYQSSGDDGKAKTEFVDANLSLTVQAVINPDDSIILDINATNSSIGSTVNTGAGSAPAIDTKEAKTKVIVRNGETTVIGGIFVESENKSKAGVPLLMDIPIIGHLFRSDSTTNARSELLVFITPRIVQ